MMNKNKPKSERGHPLRHTNITKCKPKVVVKKNLSRAKSLSVVAKSLVKSAQARHARHGSTKNSNVPYQKLQKSSWICPEKKKYTHFVENLFQRLTKLGLTAIAEGTVSLSKQLPDNVFYFFGSVFQLLRGKTSAVSLSQFIKMCDRVYEQSRRQDIVQMLSHYQRWLQQEGRQHQSYSQLPNRQRYLYQQDNMNSVDNEEENYEDNRISNTATYKKQADLQVYLHSFVDRPSQFNIQYEESEQFEQVQVNRKQSRNQFRDVQIDDKYTTPLGNTHCNQQSVRPTPFESSKYSRYYQSPQRPPQSSVFCTTLHAKGRLAESRGRNDSLKILELSARLDKQLKENVIRMQNYKQFMEAEE